MVTHHKDYTNGRLVFKNIEDKESADKTAKYKRLNVEFETNERREDPKFELSRVNINSGLTFEQEPSKMKKLQAFVKFPTNKSEIKQSFVDQGYENATERANEVYDDVMSCIQIPEMDEIKGWVDKKDLELTVDVGVCNGVTKGSIKVYSSDSKATVKTLLDKDVSVEVLGKSSDGSMLEVKSGGNEGFFYKLKRDIARIVFENRVRCGMASKSYEDILAVVRDPIYYAREKTGELVTDRDPSSFMKVTYFAENRERGRDEAFAKFSVPLGDESQVLDLNTLQNKSITCIPCMHLLYVYIGSGKVLPQFYITSAIVTSIDDFKKKTRTQLQGTLNTLSKDTVMMTKLKEQMEKIKLSPVHAAAPEPVEATQPTVNRDARDGDSGESAGQSIQDFLESGPTLHDADLDEDINDLSD